MFEAFTRNWVPVSSEAAFPQKEGISVLLILYHVCAYVLGSRPSGSFGFELA